MEKRLQQGFTLIEILLGIGIFAIGGAAVVSLVLSSYGGAQTGAEQTQAAAFAREGYEAARSISFETWNELEAGTYGLDDTSGEWELVGTPDTDGIYTRTVLIEDVDRDVSGDIAVAGTNDVHTRRVTTTIDWTRLGLPKSTSFVDYFTHWERFDFFEDLLADFTDGTFTNTDTASSDDGEVVLEGSAGGGMCDPAEDDSQTDFDEGTYADTQWDTDHVELDGVGLTNGTGTYTSEIHDATVPSIWGNLSWVPTAPYGKNLPDDEGNEQSAGGSADWWDSNYGYRQKITFGTAHDALVTGYTATLQMDTQTGSTNVALASGDDVRIVWQPTVGADVELDRIGDTWNNAATNIEFRLQSDIAANLNEDPDGTYYVYYGHAGAGTPGTNEMNVYYFADFFNRADSSTVGNGWTEWVTGGGDVSIVSNHLEVAGNNVGPPDAGIKQTFALGAITQDFSVFFDWTMPTNPEGIWTHYVNVGDSASMVDSSRTTGVGPGIYNGEGGHFSPNGTENISNDLSGNMENSINGGPHEIELRVDFANDDYDYYRGGALQASNQNWVNGGVTIDQIRIATDQYVNTATSFEYEDLRIVLNVSDDPEEALDGEEMFVAGSGSYDAHNVDMANNEYLLHLDETSGSTFDETSGGNNDASCATCPDVGQTGQLGNAVDFDAANSEFLTSPADLNQWLGGTASLAFWMNSTQSGADTAWTAPGITGVEDSGTGDDIFWGYIDASGNIRAQAGNGAAAESTSVVNDGSWHHIVITRDATSGDFNIYVDGVLEDTTTSETGTKPTSFTSIGRIEDTGGSPVYYDGLLDEFAVFSYEIDQTMVTSMYRRGVQRLLFQVRSCDDAACDTETFIGPDGTGSTYYSELQNATIDLPDITMTNVPDNQYFQYQVTFETDDNSLNPELQSVDTTCALACTDTPQTEVDDEQSEFDEGTYNDTQYDTDHVELDATGLSNGFGSYDSAIIDSTDSGTEWDTIAWTPTKPYGKPLPDSGATESAYPSGNQDMTNNLVLYHMEETSGATTIVDTSGNSRDAACTGGGCPVFETTGKINDSHQYNGAEDFIEDTDAENYINGLSAFTVSVWVKSDATGTDRGIFQGKTPNGDDDVFALRYDDAGASGGGDDVIKAGLNVNSSTIQYESASLVQTTDWQHLVLTWSSGNPLQLYIDGVADTPTHQDSGISGSITDATTLIIGQGAKDTGGSDGWDGTIDEFAMWSEVLTAQEITDLYERGAYRNRFRVRSCDDAACSGESFVGPDGTGSTFYEEANNTAVGLPSFNLTNVSDNQYFQYRATLETDDNTGSPEVQDVTIGYTACLLITSQQLQIVDNEQSEFDTGTYTDTEWDTDHVELDATGQTNGTGTYASEVFNAGETTTSWDTLSWTEDLDLLGELRMEAGSVNVPPGSAGGPAQYVDDTQGEFDAGSYNNTQFNTDHVELTGAGQTAGSGTYQSQIFDSGSGTTTWDDFSWVPEAPYGKELPDNQAAESAYTNGNIDMADNQLLMHLNEAGGATSFTDDSGNGNTGTCTVGFCPTAEVAGQLDTAVTFDGVDESIEVPDDATVSPTTEVTVAGWLNANGAGETIGDITNSLIDTLNTGAGITPSLLHISGDIYAVTAQGPGGDGWVVTYSVDNVGQISSIIDSLEYDTADALDPEIIHVTGTVYVIVYEGVDGDGFAKTMTIDAAGNISTVIDTLEWDTAVGDTPTGLMVDSNTLLIAHDGQGNDGFVRTLDIDGAGNIAASVTDTLEFNPTNAQHPDLINVGSGVYAVVYDGENNDGFISTFTVDTAGNIGGSVIETVEYDLSQGDSPSIVNVAGDMYAIAYEGAGGDGFVATITIDATGDIAAAVTDTLEFNATDGIAPELIHIHGEVYAVAYEGPDLDAFVNTFTITSAGTIGGSVIDTYEYGPTDGIQNKILHANRDIFLVATSVGGNHIAGTFRINAGRGVYKPGSYGVFRDTTTAYATVAGQVISAAAPSGWAHVALTYDSAAGSNQHKLYVNGAEVATGTLTDTMKDTRFALNLGRHYDGSLDELAIFDNALTATEISDIYERGALNLRFQVRSCDDAACSGETFEGPDDTGSTYFDEMSYTGSGLPTFTLTNVGDNQYFQYEATLETDDTSLTPELNSVTIDYTGAATSGWTTVNLAQSYVSPVVVGLLDESNNTEPVSVRVRNVTTNSFEVSLQTPGSGTLVADDVHYLVVEEGSHELPGGNLIEAGIHNTSTVSYKSNWSGDTVNFNSSFGSAPAVFHQLMSDNDTSWITTAIWGASRTSPPSASSFTATLNGAEAVTTHGSAEDIGWIAIQTGTGTIGSTDFEVAITSDSVAGHDNGCNTFSFSNTYASAPIAMADQQEMDGNDGSWGVMCSLSTTQIGVHAEEDQETDTERAHTTETFAFAAFEQAFSYADALDITFQVRSCDDAACSGETYVGPDGTAGTNFTTPGGESIDVPDNQYFQYIATFTSPHPSVSPELSSVTIDYTVTTVGGGGGGSGFQTTGTYESSVLDAGVASSWNTIEWSEDTATCVGSDIRLQIRTAPTALALSTELWQGPDGEDADETDYFTDPVGSFIHTDHNGDQFFQYRATLDGDGTCTPELQDILVTYQ